MIPVLILTTVIGFTARAQSVCTVPSRVNAGCAVPPVAPVDFSRQAAGECVDCRRVLIVGALAAMPRLNDSETLITRVREGYAALGERVEARAFGAATEGLTRTARRLATLTAWSPDLVVALISPRELARGYLEALSPATDTLAPADSLENTLGWWRTSLTWWSSFHPKNSTVQDSDAQAELILRPLRAWSEASHVPVHALLWRSAPEVTLPDGNYLASNLSRLFIPRVFTPSLISSLARRIPVTFITSPRLNRQRVLKGQDELEASDAQELVRYFPQLPPRSSR